MRRARPGLRADELVVTWEAEDGGTGMFRVTGKPNTATTFAFTVGADATYKNNIVQGKMTGSWTLPEPLTELLSPIPLPLY